MSDELFVGMSVSVIVAGARYNGKVLRVEGDHVLIRRELKDTSIDPDVLVHEDYVTPMIKRNLAEW